MIFALMFVLIFLMVLCVLLGLCFLLGMAAGAVLLALTVLGVLSSSFAIGLIRRRPADGLRAFLLQIGLLAGIPAGILCGALLQWLLAANALVPALLGGALAGAGAGSIVAFSMDCLFRFIHRRTAPYLCSLLSSSASKALADSAGS